MANEIKLSARPGYAEDTKCVITLVSLTNLTTSFSVNGGNFAPFATWTRTGTDDPGNISNIPPTQPGVFTEAGFVAHVQVSQLSPNTEYTYTANQDGNIISGKFRTKPGMNDDFSLFFVCCDVNPQSGIAGSGLTDAASIAAGWTEIRNYAENGALPVAAIIHCDDTNGYADATSVNDDDASTKLTRNITPALNFGYNSVFDYALSHLNAFGLFSATAVQGDTHKWGQHADRVWCTLNLNYLYQWGDHEFVDDLGWDLDPADGADGEDRFIAGKGAWDEIIKPMMPPMLDEANSYAWGIDFGCLHITTIDGVTNGNGLSGGAGQVIFGTPQIDDLKTDLAGSRMPFKILGMTNGIRYLDNTQSEFRSGSQHTVFEGALSEYQDLFTNDVDGLMTREGLNGGWGIMWTMHGDYHRGLVLDNHAPAYAGNVAENFKSIHTCTIGGSLNFAVDGDAGETTIVEGLDFNGSLVEYLQDSGTFDPYPPEDAYGWQICRLDVYGSASPRRVEVVMKRERPNLALETSYTHTFTEQAMTDLKYSDPGIAIPAEEVTDDATFGITNDLAGTPVDATVDMVELGKKLGGGLPYSVIMDSAILMTIPNSSWVDVTGITDVSIDKDPNVTVDGAAGTMTFTEAGTYRVSVGMLAPTVRVTPSERIFIGMNVDGVVSGQNKQYGDESNVELVISSIKSIVAGAVLKMQITTDAAADIISAALVSSYVMVERLD